MEQDFKITPTEQPPFLNDEEARNTLRKEREGFWNKALQTI